MYPVACCCEVWLLVLEYLDRADLTRVALTSKRYNWLATRVLYRHVSIVGPIPSCSLLHNLIGVLSKRGESNDCPGPATYVHTLHLDMQSANGTVLQHSANAAARYAAVFAALTNLHTLALGEAFNAFLSIAVANVHLPNLRRLALHCAVGMEPFVARHSMQLTHLRIPYLDPRRLLSHGKLCPNLQHLEAASLQTVSWATATSSPLTTVSTSACKMRPGGGFDLDTSHCKTAFQLVAR